MKIDRIDSIKKPYTVHCYHHYVKGVYVGAVWLETEDLGGKWKAYATPDIDSCLTPPPGWRCTRGAGHTGPCAAIEGGVGHLGEFDSRGEAYEALEKSLEKV